jgi:hypothetical protein
MRSTAYDVHIYQETEHLHPQLPWELIIGDGHFATCARFFTPAQKNGGRTLTSREIMWNEWLQFVRSRVKHINTVIKKSPHSQRRAVSGLDAQLENIRAHLAAWRRCGAPPPRAARRRPLPWVWALGALIFCAWLLLIFC